MHVDPTFEDWKEAEEAAESLVPLVGRLYRDHGIVTLVHGRRLIHLSPVEIVQAHRRGHRRFGHDVSLVQMREALQAVADLGLAPVEIDVGKLLLDLGDRAVVSHIQTACAGLARRNGAPLPGGRDVVLYGFGRIGRILARLLVARAGGGEKYNLRAIVVRKRAEDDLERRANLLRRDSVHGLFEGEVRTLPDENAMLINGTKVQLIYASAPEAVDYTAHGITNAIVIDNTGGWRDEAGLSRHLQAKGTSKVILTAPGKGGVKNIVFGVNEHILDGSETIISAASCTTNAIVPVLKAVDDTYGILSGHIETVHAYTNDQNLIDNYHPKARRGRGAALNLVITETGAAKAAVKALPHLDGKLTASAIRVPTPNVSLAIMNLQLRDTVTKDGLNSFLYEAAYASDLSDQIGWTAMVDTVSSDMVGDTHGGVVDSEATIVSDSGAVLYVWYDNEYGYSCQVMRLLGHVANLSRPKFP